MAKQPETHIASVLQMMMEMRAEDDTEERERREEERRRENLRREETRREEELRREESMILALKAAQPAVPQTVTVVNHELPRMKDGEDIDTLVAMFEAALRANNVPDTLWKAKLHSHRNMKTKLRIQ